MTEHEKLKIRVGQMFDVAMPDGTIHRGFCCTDVSPGGFANGVAMGAIAENVPPGAILNVRDLRFRKNKHD